LFELISGFLATRAVAGRGQNRRADCLEFHLTALAHREEMFVLFLVHVALGVRILDIFNREADNSFVDWAE
jgi:hypothetical protein